MGDEDHLGAGGKVGEDLQAGQELAALTAARVGADADVRRAVRVTPGTVNRRLSALASAIKSARREREWGVVEPVPQGQLGELRGPVRRTERDAHLAPENTRAALARLDEPAASDLESRRA